MRGFDLSPGACAAALRGVHVASEASADVYARVVWSVLTEPGDRVAGALIAALGAAPALQHALSGAAIEGLPGRELATARERWMPRADPALVATALERARRSGTRLVVPGDAEWPARLDDLGEHAPHVLWMQGTPDDWDATPAVALVGARAATGYGEHVAAELASDLAGGGVTVVSGAAYGIDGVAHRAALSAGGRTVALLAGGIDRPYPTGHTDLIRRIASHGVVAGETPCGTAPSKWRFLARNRLIAALSDATIIVEAGVRSGSLNTAAHAASLGRALGAVPGPVTSAASAGAHRVLREFDGVCITGADDVRELLGLSVSAPALSGGRTAELTRLLDAASTRVAVPAVELARRSGLAVAEVEALLGLASLSGDLVADGDGWRRAPTR
ncbi:DNA-protecting protein DprA [Microbacterium lushaniae]|nr:DNA-protecting protein DprA [Microbacterium lushaniae]